MLQRVWNDHLLKSILDQANTGIYIMNEKGDVVYVNDFFLDLIGYSREDEIEKKSFEIIAPQERARIRKELEKRLSGKTEKASYTTKLIHKNGREIDIALDVNTLRDKDGEIIGVLGFVRDITQQLQAVLERKRLEEQALMIEKMAALGRLATTVAHQINNPLEAIKNYVYLVREEVSSNPDLFDMLNRVETEIFRVAGLTRQIVEFAIPSSSQFVLYDLDMVMDDTLLLLDKKIRNNNVTLIRKIDKNLPHVKGSPEQMKQAFINIIFNALDAMEKGGKLIVRAEQRDDDIEIRFEDSGEGISKENLKRIFDPFFTTKDKHYYLGLGLSVSLHIIHNNNGMIRVESEPDALTSVIISLPVSD